MKKIRFRILALLLTVLMLAQTLPLATYAVELRLEPVEEEWVTRPLDFVPTEIPLPQSSKEAHILYELTEERTVNTKYFLMSDRSVLATVYEYPVHFLENGTWKDINLGVSVSKEELEMTENAFETKFSKKSNGKKLVTLTKDHYTLSWYAEGAEKVDAQYSTQEGETPENPSSLKNVTGSVTYPAIFHKTDLQYVVSGNGIKENLILLDTSSPGKEYIND